MNKKEKKLLEKLECKRSRQEELLDRCLGKYDARSLRTQKFGQIRLSDIDRKIQNIGRISL